jgi:hypothetical protein
LTKYFDDLEGYRIFFGCGFFYRFWAGGVVDYWDECIFCFNNHIGAGEFDVAG